MWIVFDVGANTFDERSKVLGVWAENDLAACLEYVYAFVAPEKRVLLGVHRMTDTAIWSRAQRLRGEQTRVLMVGRYMRRAVRQIEVHYVEGSVGE